MPNVTVLPHIDLCPEGITFEAEKGVSVCDALLENKIGIEHACEKSCACTTCHVIVRKGLESLKEATDLEEDLLDKAWGLEVESRLSCQSLITDSDLTIEIPLYTINHARENHS